MKTWLVCGGRDFGNIPIRKDKNGPDKEHKDFLKKKTERDFIIKTLDQLTEERSDYYNPYDNWLPSDIKIISGGAAGVDTVAIEFAVVNWCDCKEYPADWKKYGKSAGYIRNKQMLVEGNPDLVIAFPGGKGTANMVKLTREAGVEVIEISYDRIT